MVTEMTTDLEPVDIEPIQKKIDRVVEQARETKNRYAAFRGRMFDEALREAETILCSTFRLQLLAGKERDFYKKYPEVYINSASNLLRMLGKSPFILLSRERGEQPELQSYFPEDVSISIPKSEAYNKRSLPIAKLTFREQIVPSASIDADGLTTDWNTKEVVESSIWHFDPIEKCPRGYTEPVVYSPTARRESSENMATLIASSLQNLRSYPAKLETVEREWSRANDLEILLPPLRERANLSQVDPTIRKSVRNYERELTEAVAVLEREQAENRIDTTVSPGEVNNILRLFR